MRYQNATKMLLKRITELQKVISDREREMENPEMTCDIEFAKNDIESAKEQILEFQEAVRILQREKE